MNKKEKIGILGLGKLGICFALNAERAGFEVVGVEIDEDRVRSISNKSLVSYEPEVEEYLSTAKFLHVSSRVSDLLQEDLDLIFVMVATPTSEDGGYDHYQLDRVCDELAKAHTPLHDIHLVVVCTTMPGYCDKLATKMADTGFKISYNPEFIAQGNIMHDQQFPDQVLIGEANSEAGDRIEAVYKKICLNEPVFCRMDPLSAEITKLATNCFLTTKISFANSIGDLCEKSGADTEKVLAAIGSDSRIGPKYLRYGFGFGGPCFPRDNRALGTYARDMKYELLLSNATDEVNKRHLEFQFESFMNKFKEDELIVFEYVTYKRGTILLDESQQLQLALKLVNAGRKVEVQDNIVVIQELKTMYGDIFQYKVV